MTDPRYSSLDAMIEHGVYRAHGDSWHKDEVYLSCAKDYISTRAVWDELHHIQAGQIDYRDNVFIVTHEPARTGMGGMDEGSPESVAVYRIRGKK